MHRLRLRPGHRLRERPKSVADRLSRALRVHAERARRCSAQRPAVQARRRQRRQRVVGESTRLPVPARLAGAEVSSKRHRVRLGSHGRSPASPHGVGRARDRLGQRRRQGQRLLRPPRAQAAAGPALARRAARVRRRDGALAGRARAPRATTCSFPTTARRGGPCATSRARSRRRPAPLVPGDAQARAVRVLAEHAAGRHRARRGRGCERVLHAHRRAGTPRRVPARLHRRAVVLDRLRRRRRARRFAAERGRRGRAGAGGRRSRAVSRHRRARRELGRRPHQPLLARRRLADAGHPLARRRSRPRHRRLRRRQARRRARAVVRYTVRNVGKRARRLALALAWRPFQANPPTQFLAHPRRREPDRDREVGRPRPVGQRRAAPAADAVAEQRSRRACGGRAGRRLARRGAAGRPRDERQRPRWLRERRAALRHAAAVPASTGSSTSSCRSRRRRCPRKSRRRPRRSPRRRALAQRSTGSASTAPARWPTSPGRCAPPSATSSSTAAARPCSPAHAPMRDRGFATGR